MHARWLLLALLCGAAMPVAAADLTVRFTGRFLAGTCQLSVQDVDLGTFQATYFATSTQSPAVAFVLERKNCSDDLRTLHVRFVGTADSSNASYFAIPAQLRRHRSVLCRRGVRGRSAGTSGCRIAGGVPVEPAGRRPAVLPVDRSTTAGCGRTRS